MSPESERTEYSIHVPPTNYGSENHPSWGKENATVTQEKADGDDDGVGPRSGEKQPADGTGVFAHPLKGETFDEVGDDIAKKSKKTSEMTSHYPMKPGKVDAAARRR